MLTENAVCCSELDRATIYVLTLHRVCGTRVADFYRKDLSVKKELTLACLMCFTLTNCAWRQAVADETTDVVGENNTSEVPRLRFTAGVRTILHDSGGNYWFGSHGEGLARYNGQTIEYFTTKNGLADDHIRCIQEDSQGAIWVDTQHGVSRYEGNAFVSFPETQPARSSSKLAPSLSGSVQEQWQKSDVDMWFSAGTREGVFRYDGQQFRYLPFPHPTASVRGNTNAVTGFSAGRNNMLWISTYAGVFGYDGENLMAINDETLGYSNRDDRIHVRCILEDSQGRLWIGNNGIGVLLKEGETIVNFSKEQGRLMPMEAFESNTLAKRFTANTGLQSVFALAEDCHGNIWFGDRDTGAWRYDGKALVNFDIDEKLESQMIYAIYEDRHQNLLFAMAQGGVYQFGGDTFFRKY